MCCGLFASARVMGKNKEKLVRFLNWNSNLHFDDEVLPPCFAWSRSGESKTCVFSNRTSLMRRSISTDPSLGNGLDRTGVNVFLV